MERLRPRLENGERYPRIIPPIYRAIDIRDVVESRERLFHRSRLIYTFQNQAVADLPFLKRGIARTMRIPKSPTEKQWTLRGRQTVEHSSSAIILIPSVRHLPVRDASKQQNALTLFDTSGELQAEPLNNWVLYRVLQQVGLPVHKAKDLKEQDWASAVLLLSRFQNVKGQPQGDSHVVLGAFNEHIGGQKIPTLLGKLVMAGLVVKPGQLR